MSFWEELGNTITEGSAEILQKIKDETGAASLRADNAASERKIREYYTRIGELLVKGCMADLSTEAIEALLQEDPAPLTRDISLTDWKEIYTKVQLIREEEQSIARNAEKISALRGTVSCPGCGRVIARKISFCPDCGTKIVWPDKPAASEAESGIMDGEYVSTDAGSSAEGPDTEK